MEPSRRGAREAIFRVGREDWRRHEKNVAHGPPLRRVEVETQKQYFVEGLGLGLQWSKRRRLEITVGVRLDGRTSGC